MLSNSVRLVLWLIKGTRIYLWTEWWEYYQVLLRKFGLLGNISHGGPPATNYIGEFNQKSDIILPFKSLFSTRRWYFILMLSS